jgi:hypothetical protein
MTHIVRRAGWVAAVLVALAGLPQQTTRAAPEPSTLGVVDFYAIVPVETVTGVVPQATAADQLSALLAQASDTRYTVIPRRAMGEGEAALGWQESDVLRFARLQALANRVHADRLVVGWIEVLAVGDGSAGTGFPRIGERGTPTGFASLVVQVFDASRGRITAEVRGTGYAQGIVRARITEATLENALQPLAGALLPALTASGP